MTSTAPQTRTVPAWGNPADESWLGLSARFGRFVGHVSGRTDLIARVAPDENPKRPIACFVPALAEVRFTANKIWDTDVDPATVDPNDGLDRARHPQMVGAACHEAAHAAHTRLAIPKGTEKAHAHWAVLLEEPRIEAHLVARRPADRVWLRAAAIQLCADGSLSLGADETDGAASRYQACRSAVLFLGRVAAGVLTEQETAALRDEIVDVLGEDSMVEVDAVLAEAIAAEDGDTATLIALGARLAAVVGEDTPVDDQGDQQQGDQQQGDGDPGDPGDGAGQGSGNGDNDPQGGDEETGGDAGDAGEDSSGTGGGGRPGDDRDDDRDGSGSGSEDTDDDATAHQMPCGSWTEGDVPEDTNPWEAPQDTPQGDGEGPSMTEAIRATAEQVAADADRKAKAAAFTAPPVNPGAAAEKHDAEVTAAAHAATFGTEAAPIAVFERTPTGPVQEQARRLTWALRRAQFRGIARTTTPSLAPPGRMRMGEVMRRDAQKAARARITAQPWKQTRRRHVEQPPLTVGFSGDVSASMQAWQTVTADMSWALAQAVTHLAGRTAAVAWNANVAPTMRPGQAPAAVQEAACRGGSRGCALSLRALDGALNLTATRDGARAVVVVTDGQLGDTYPVINPEVARLTRAGVKVLWVTPKPDRRVHPSATNLVLAAPADFGDAVGKALADLLAAT